MTGDKWALAIEFSRQLEQAIGIELLDLAVDMNSRESDPGICHSHDHCDANQCMLDAAGVLGLGDEFNVEDEQQLRLFNEAWDIAKGCEFDPEEIERTRDQLGE